MINVPADAEPAARKRAIRESVLAQRSALTTGERAEASASIASKLLSHVAYAHAHCVLAYVSFGDEVDSTLFLEHVLQSGKQLVLPRVDTQARRLVLHHVNALSDLVSGVWGIREPRADAPVASLSGVDFALIPGVAFDRRGGRLGYGGGFYDKLLATSLPQTRALVRLSTAFSCQLIDEVPMTPHDIRIPTIITEHEVIDAHDR
jgi:5-formyltetrahydrofolate cyclo-ligase